MLSRLVSAGLRSTQAARSIRLSAFCLGGHGSHVPVPEPHIPRPQPQYETDWLGRKIVPRLIKDQKHEHTAGHYACYAVGALFLLGTIATVAFYTDTWGMNVNKNKTRLHQRTFPKPAQPESVEEESVMIEAASVTDTPEETVAPETETSDQVEESAPKNEILLEQKESENPEIPGFVEYLLVGSGTGAYYASLAIRARDADAKVLMIGEENDLPYNRSPLSKELWWYGNENTNKTLEYKGLNGKNRDIFYEAEGFFVPAQSLDHAIHGGVSLLKGVRVEQLDVKNKVAILNNGSKVKYGKVLLATGCKPKKISELESVNDKVIYFAGISDFRRLDSLCSNPISLTIIGGGFLGSELAYSIKRRYPNVKVQQIIYENGPLATVFPAHLADHAQKSFINMGIDIRTGCKVSAATKDEFDKVSLHLSDSSILLSDYVVVADGVEPDVKIAENSGIELDSINGGFYADAQLRVSDGIWCAGDACSYFSGPLGRRRVEHWENAQITGRLAGENMTGGVKDFWYQPSYFTKISPDLHINAVGQTDSELKTVSVYAKQADDFPNKYHKGVVFYTKDEKIVGCLLVNVFGAGIDVARRLIDEGRTVEDYKQLAKLFQLFDPEKPATAESEEKNNGE